MKNYHRNNQEEEMFVTKLTNTLRNIDTTTDISSIKSLEKTV